MGQTETGNYLAVSNLHGTVALAIPCPPTIPESVPMPLVEDRYRWTSSSIISLGRQKFIDIDYKLVESKRKANVVVPGG